MRFAVILACSVSRVALHEAALGFVRASREAGHEIVGVFLLQDGVELALNGGSPNAAGHALLEDWLRLSAAREPLLLGACVGALARRQAEHSGVESEGPSPPFEPMGLGHMLSMLLSADRLVEFRG